MDRTDRIWSGAGKSPVRRVGSGKAPKKRTFVGPVSNQSKLKKAPKKRA